MHKSRRESQGFLGKTPRKALGTLPFTLLSDPTPLIGRDRELEVLRHHLLGDSVRLLTVMGPGGVGKTRLALAAARSVEGAFPDGVWFIDLVPLQDPAHIDATITHALHLEDVARHSPRERLDVYLKHRRLLLILDNFEHVLPAATRVAELVATCPYVKVLVTSREPLNLRLEQRMVLQGLAVPDIVRATPEAVAQAPATALFLAQASRIQPDFAVMPEDARALAELVHRLDGMPLAIQITAAHSNVLSPAAMLARLQGPALLSTEEARDVPLRHHTLRDAIEWSHALLDRGEQELFRQLGVFAGGWTLEAAEDIVKSQDPGAPLWQTLRSLVEKSLVQTEGVGDDERRYRMLETIREFALERLAASGDLDTARQRHAEYYLALAERARPALFGPEENEWYRRLELEHNNIRAALRWAADGRDGEFGLRLAGALADFWVFRNYLREGRRWLEDARVLGSEASPLVRASALAGEGILAVLQGDYLQARALLRDALAVAESLRDPALTAGVLARLGAVAVLQGDAGDARVLLERSLALRRVARVHEVVLALAGLGRVFVLLEDLERADITMTEALDVARTAGSPRQTAFALGNLARLKLKRQDYTGAAALASEALRLARATQSRSTIKHVAGIAALLCAHRGDVERAARLLAAADPSSEWTGEAVSPTYQDPTVGPALHERARQQMGDAAYHAAVAEAHTMSVDQVAELAEASLEPPRRSGPERAAGTGEARSPALLSDREQAVLRLIAEGLPNKQIATSLAIAERTVKSHVTSAMNKLGVDNRAHAVVMAIQRGIL